MKFEEGDYLFTFIILLYLRLDRDMHPKINKDAPGVVEIGQMILVKIFQKFTISLYIPPP